MKKATEKLDWITKRLAENMTVYVSTTLKTVKITSKTAQRFVDAGHDLFKIDSTGSLLMARGRHYDCIDGCALRARAE